MLKKHIVLVAKFAIIGFVLLNSSARADIHMHGANCKPANLRQALELGLSWSQFGTTNASAIGGSAFFVVCPFNFDSDRDDINGGTDQLFIQATFLSASASPIQCTLIETDGGSDGGSVESTQTLPPIAPEGDPLPDGFSGTIAVATTAFSAPDDELSMVCALQPQTRITAYSIITPIPMAEVE